MKQQIRAPLLVGAGILIGLLIPAAWGNLASQAQTSGGCQTSPQTGHRACGKFLQYWQSHGSLAQQGYPISEECVEPSALDAKPYTVQYFDRAFAVVHPH